MVEYNWVDDPDGRKDIICPECDGPTVPLKIDPDRSLSYLTHIYMCQTAGCKRAWPRNGARKLESSHTTGLEQDPRWENE
jgi:hypothetical protein